MTERSNTGLLGAILTLRFSCVIAMVPFIHGARRPAKYINARTNWKRADSDLNLLSSTMQIHASAVSNPGVLGKCGIGCKFLLDELVEFLGTHFHRLHAEHRKLGANSGRLQCLFYLSIQPVDDIRRGLGRRRARTDRPNWDSRTQASSAHLRAAERASDCCRPMGAACLIQRVIALPQPVRNKHQFGRP